MRIVWLPQVIDDLKRGREFLRLQNVQAAQRAVLAISKMAALLAANPRFGMMAREAPDFRDVVVPFGRRNYVLRYRIDGDDIVIVALRHTREVGFTDR
jgi:plasmid stabilization system protein ParE